MSLRFDTNKCPAGPVGPDTPDDESSWLDAIVMYMPFLDLMTVEVEETLWRIRFLERVGYGITRDPVPLAMVRRWEGTTVNVPTKTRTAFVNRWKHELVRDMDYAVKQEVK